MAVPRRKFTREEPQARRADLIGAVLDLMAEAGPAETTVRAIAEAAGLSPGMIRHHFTSKEDLVNAAYDTRELSAEERDALLADGDPLGPTDQVADEAMRKFFDEEPADERKRRFRRS